MAGAKRFVWVYPARKLTFLRGCDIFFGTEKEYREWIADELSTVKLNPRSSHWGSPITSNTTLTIDKIVKRAAKFERSK